MSVLRRNVHKDSVRDSVKVQRGSLSIQSKKEIHFKQLKSIRYSSPCRTHRMYTRISNIALLLYCIVLPHAGSIIKALHVNSTSSSKNPRAVCNMWS